MVQLPGLQDPKQLRDLLGTTAKMTFHLVPTNVDINNPPVGVSVLPGYTDETQRYAVYDQVSLDGNVLEDARQSFDPQMPGRSLISFKMNSVGAKIFAEITRQNIGRPFAIVLDNKVLTAPVIQGIIPGGQGQITGNFDAKEASTLAALLRAGALPAPLTVIEERTVGPAIWLMGHYRRRRPCSAYNPHLCGIERTWCDTDPPRHSRYYSGNRYCC